METREKLLELVIDKEFAMFDTVSNAGGRSACQEHPQTFRAMRWMTFSVQEDVFLVSYLRDLEQAEEAGRNFMTEKYARIDNLIPQISDFAVIPLIVNIEKAWLEELHKLYPYSFRTNIEGFCAYLSAELETYSEESLLHYYTTVNEASEASINLMQQRYRNLYKKLDMPSLEEKEALLRAKKEE